MGNDNFITENSKWIMKQTASEIVPLSISQGTCWMFPNIADPLVQFACIPIDWAGVAVFGLTLCIIFTTFTNTQFAEAFSTIEWNRTEQNRDGEE